MDLLTCACRVLDFECADQAFNFKGLELRVARSACCLISLVLLRCADVNDGSLEFFGGAIKSNEGILKCLEGCRERRSYVGQGSVCEGRHVDGAGHRREWWLGGAVWPGGMPALANTYATSSARAGK